MRTQQKSELTEADREENRGTDLYARTFVPLGIPEMPVMHGPVPPEQLTCPTGSMLLAGVPVLVSETSADNDRLEHDLRVLASMDDEDNVDDFDDVDDEDEDLDELDDLDDDLDDEDWEDEFEDEEDEEDDFDDDEDEFDEDEDDEF